MSYKKKISSMDYMTYPSFHQILGTNVDNSASNGLGRVEAQCVVFIPLPWVKNSFLIYCPLINGPRHSYIDQLTDKRSTNELTSVSTSRQFLFEE